MTLAEGLTMSDTEKLMKPPASPAEVDLNYWLLIYALNEGWYVEEPVYLRPRWMEGSPRVYHFILRRSPLGSPRLLTVPESPEIERLVRDQSLEIASSG
jgi:hypothetical protein